LRPEVSGSLDVLGITTLRSLPDSKMWQPTGANFVGCRSQLEPVSRVQLGPENSFGPASVVLARSDKQNGSQKFPIEKGKGILNFVEISPTYVSSLEEPTKIPLSTSLISIFKKPTRMRNLAERSTFENISSNRFSNKLWKSSIAVPLKKRKKWICYGKRIGPDQVLPTGSLEQFSQSNKLSSSLTSDSEVPMTQIIYDQQNMLQCFQDRNLYRFLFAFFYSLWNRPLFPEPWVKFLRRNNQDEQKRSYSSQQSWQWQIPQLSSFQDGRAANRVGSTRPKVQLISVQRMSSKKIILFGRSEVKRLFRKVLFIKPESILFSQIFLIPLAAFFGIVYTFWTFSVSSTVTLKEYIPIAQQRMSLIKKRIDPVGSTQPEQSVGGSLLREKEPTGSSHQSWLAPMTDWSDSEVLEEVGLEELPFFTSYKVDWSPTRGLADFLRFTNTASKIFILWASLTVFRSLRPVKANRPEMRIQTRFLRPFQNRKRFRDLEGIEKFSGVLTTLTESIQGSFKDPLFYLVLALPNLPFFQPFQKAIGKFRFFLFYGKQTEFLRKPMSFLIGMFFPKEKQKQAQTYPKGYLFIGPPGTGKTLLAQAIAGESKVNLICLSASEIQKQLDIGTRIGALRLRNLFEEARTLTPCILFFDEIDTLGRARQGLSQVSGDSIGSTKTGPEVDLKLFTEFLVQMDSFSVKDGFLVIGTTNFLSSLDPAFVRSGRFDRILGLTYPPKQTRIAILKLHIRKKGNIFDQTIPWNIFGLKTKELSPADLAKVVNESSLYILNQLNSQPRWLSPNKIGNGVEPVKPVGSMNDSNFTDCQPKKEGVFDLIQSIAKDLFLFQPGLIHTSQSLREGLVKILESKR
jgi:hypothetical protein